MGCVTGIDVLLLLLLFVLEILHHHIERGYSRIIIVAGGFPAVDDMVCCTVTRFYPLHFTDYIL